MFRWRTWRDAGWQDFDRLRREMDSLLNTFSTGMRQWPSPLWRGTRLFPLLNVKEKADAFVVSAEIPGMKKEDLEIKIENDTLTLKGERKPDQLGENVSHHRRERATGSFQRSLTLPGKVDAEKVNATYKNGVLTVTLAKEKAAQPRQISIETAE